MLDRAALKRFYRFSIPRSAAAGDGMRLDDVTGLYDVIFDIDRAGRDGATTADLFV